MPRGRKRSTDSTEPAAIPIKRRGRRKQSTTEGSSVTETRDPKLVEAEAELIEKYGARIKKGSLLPSGTLPEFGTKRTVVIICADCNAERVVATSDVFHVSRCADCTKKARRKSTKKEATE